MRKQWLVPVVVAVALTAVAAPVFLLRDKQIPVEWQVASVGSDGRSLLIQVLGDFSHCDAEPSVRLSGVSSERAVIEARIADRDCTDLDQRFIPLIEVDLGRPIAGQRIVGAGKTARRTRPAPGASDRMPRVVGLRAEDALPALRTAGFDPIPTAPTTESVVSKQEPRAGELLQVETDLTVKGRVTLSWERP